MQRTRLVLIVSWVLGAFVLSAVALSAQGPQPQAPDVALGTGFTYQGQLKKNGSPVNDVCSLTFSLWNSQNNGTGQIGSDQTIVPVTITTGVFTELLNDGGQFGPNPFNGQERWLQAAVLCPGAISATTLSRQRLTGVPYALFAAAPWLTSGSSLYYTLGSVGIGTINPNSGKLDVETADGTAVYGSSTNYIGVVGGSSTNSGVYGSSTSGDGVNAFSSSGYAGFFNGRVQVNGPLTVTGGIHGPTTNFVIDHPLDPANRYLLHTSVESPDMKNIYDGVVTTDAIGDATILLPDWFEALNEDFRYQLTIVGKQWAQARIEEEIHANQFRIKTDKPNIKVSWQVTGIRHDPWAEQHRIPVEEQKPANQKGKYLHPTEYGQPETLGIDYDHRHALDQPSSTR